MKIKKNKIIISIILLIIIMFIITCIFVMKNVTIFKEQISELKKEDLSEKIDSEYRVTLKEDDTNYKILIKFTSNVDIKKISCPNDNQIFVNKKEIAIDYDIQKDNIYQFKIDFGDNEKILKLDSSKINATVIDSNESYAYPIITKSEVEVGKEVEIIYNNDKENYYSMDEGKTWEKYNGKIPLKKEKIVQAKSIVEGEIPQIVEKYIKFELAEDALGLNACDSSDDTFEYCAFKKIKIDDSIVGDYIALKLDCPAYNHIYCNFYREDGTFLETAFYWHTQNGIYEDSILVPEGAKWIAFDKIDWNFYARLYYIEYNIYDETNIVQYFDSDGVHNGKLKIKYPEEAKTKLYSYDNDNWIEYPEGGIEGVEFASIYAKSINIDNTETKYFKYTVKNKQFILKNDFDLIVDNDDLTYYACNPSGTYFKVDSSAYGKKLVIDFTANVYSRWRFTFYDEEENIVGNSVDLVNGRYQNYELEIPYGALKLKIYRTDQYSPGYMYSMDIKD